MLLYQLGTVQDWWAWGYHAVVEICLKTNQIEQFASRAVPTPEPRRRKQTLVFFHDTVALLMRFACKSSLNEQEWANTFMEN
jgi:hypothetical protein